MEKVPVKYTGKRETVTIDIGHDRYVFNKDNNYVAEVLENYLPRFIKKKVFLPTIKEVVKEVEKKVVYRKAKSTKKGKK